MALRSRLYRILFVLLFVNIVAGNSADTIKRAQRRLHIPFLGLGPYCTGCPAHYCDDDPAIIHGYCCGCASFFDKLPVRCPNYLSCPTNMKDLCEKYEYMMHCCCEG